MRCGQRLLRSVCGLFLRYSNVQLSTQGTPEIEKHGPEGLNKSDIYCHN
jgi:hypothetical protein